MVTASLWMILIGPLALVATALLPGSAKSNAARASFASLIAFAVALATAGAVVMSGMLTTGTIGTNGLGFGLYADALTATMFVLVSFVGAIVVRYSRNYLDGDPGHARFTRWLCLTLAAVLVLIVSGNMVQFIVAWIATSAGLHRLLLFYGDRPAAILASRKKFIASRIGDACLIGAAVLLYGLFGSLDYSAIFAATSALAADAVPGALHGVAALIAVAALLKSAQFPTHGWLTEVMETPTPVSALLHAGIINAGGFLVLRFADVVVLSAPSLELLAIVGGFTALLGSAVMLTQTSVKVSLAWSTIAQMGFMLLQCGLGAFGAALLHIVAHSLYKAHAFLSSGSIIDLARASWTPSPGGKLHPARMVIAIAVLAAAGAGIGALFGITLGGQPGIVALGAIVMMGLAHFVANAIDVRPSAYVIGRTLVLTAGVASAYFALQIGAERLFHGVLPPVRPLAGPLDLAIIVLVVVAFGAVTVLQNLAARGTAPRWHALYVHLANGLYVNTAANRLVLRFWPTGRRARLATQAGA